MLELSSQTAAYEAMQSTLEADHFGRWVVFHDEELVGVYDSDGDALDDAMRKFGRGPYLIRQVGLVPVPPLALVMPR